MDESKQVIVAPITSVDSEIGGSGIDVFGGSIFNVADYNRQFHGSGAVQIYDKMRVDPEVQSSLLRLKWPILSAVWDVQAASEDAVDQEAAQLCRDVLMSREFVGNPHDETWDSFLSQALLMLDYGFMAFEKVWGVDAKGRQIILKLAPRLPKSVFEFHIGDDRLLEYMEQYVVLPSGVQRPRIPADKLVLFVFGKEGDNYWGRAAIRPAYGPWFQKTTLSIIDAMRHERHGVGIPWIKLPPNAGKAERDEAYKIATELRGHERQGIVTGNSYEVTLLHIQGQGSDIMTSMKYHDTQIERATLTEGASLGAQVSGSRSLGEEKQDFLLVAIENICKVIVGAINSQVIVPMVDRNYTVSKYPRVTYENLDTMKLGDIADALQKLRTADFIQPTDDDEKYVRKIGKLPRFNPDAEKRERALPPAMTGDDDNESPPKTPAADTGKSGKKPALASTRRLLEYVRKSGSSKLARAPMEHESSVRFGEINEFLDEEPGRVYASAVYPIRKRQIKQIASAAASASEKDLAKRSLPRPLKAAMSEDVGKALQGSYRRGRLSVKEEAERQAEGKKPSRPNTARERLDALVRLALPDMEKATAKELQRIRRLADLFAESTTEDMVQRAAQVALQSKLAGLDEADTLDRVTIALNNMSEAVVVSDLEGKVINAFTRGRSDAAEVVKDEIEVCYYSAIMDEGTCVPCASLDGRAHEVGDDDYVVPNPNCDWPPHCRCVDVYIFKFDEAEPISEAVA